MTEPQRRGERRVTAEELNALTEAIIGAAIAVHRELGPGLLESVYEACLAYELRERGLHVERQTFQSIRYKRLIVDDAFRVDLVVRDELSEAEAIVELKANEKLLPIHDAQLLTHLKLSGRKVGLLMNFNVEILKSGIRRMVNRFPEEVLCGDSAPSAPPR